MSELSIDEQFAVAKRAYERRDPRPLGKFVLTNNLSAEQREFVAKALCGDIKQVDGRTVKPTTSAIMSAYDRLRTEQLVWDMYTVGQHKMNVSKIAAIIAGQFGYDDIDSVRRTINRNIAKRNNAPKVKMRVMKVGHEKK